MTCSRPILSLRATATAARRATVLAAKELQLEEATASRTYSLKNLQPREASALEKLQVQEATTEKKRAIRSNGLNASGCNRKRVTTASTALMPTLLSRSGLVPLPFCFIYI